MPIKEFPDILPGYYGLTEEKIANTRRWISDLRSEKFQQGIGNLRNKQDGYCCLGVACVPFIETGEVAVTDKDYHGAVDPNIYWFVFPREEAFVLPPNTPVIGDILVLPNQNKASGAPDEVWFDKTFGSYLMTMSVYEEDVLNESFMGLLPVELKNRINERYNSFPITKAALQETTFYYLFSVWSLNDEHRMTFSQIADIIEYMLEREIKRTGN